MNKMVNTLSCEPARIYLVPYFTELNRSIAWNGSRAIWTLHTNAVPNSTESAPYIVHQVL